MKSKKKKIIKTTIFSILSIALIYGITFYFSFFQGEVKIENNKITSNQLPDNTPFKSSYTPKTNFDDMSITSINGVKFNILDHKNLIDIPVLCKAQRYYIPINYITNILNLQYNASSNTISDSSNSNVIKLGTNSYSLNDETGSLRGNILTNNNENYISISDIEKLFNLVAIYNSEDTSITLVKSNNKVIDNPTSSDSQKVALMRLEDFSANETVLSSKNIIKYKAIANLLSANGIKYHIAWIPYYKCPDEGIDNNLLTNINFKNSSFINLLDYFINNGAAIGLHGYTHQYANSTSGVGTELGRNVNEGEAETRKVVEGAIDTATALNIPYAFFESSHYKATSKQKKIISEYVQYIYEPKSYLIYTKLQKTKDNNLFIPTPLGYVKDSHISYIQRGLSNPRPNELASFFYHPSKELDFIETNIDNNEFNVLYSDHSLLKQIIEELIKTNHTTVHVTDLKNS